MKPRNATPARLAPRNPSPQVRKPRPAGGTRHQVDTPPLKGLQKLAQAVGVQTSYLDMAQRRQHASEEALKGILELFGYSIDSERALADACEQEELKRWERPLDPVMVVWDGRPTRFQAKFLPGSVDRSTCCRLKLEDGTIKELELGKPQPLKGGKNFERLLRSIATPRLPIGYHRLQLDVGNRRFESKLIVAPTVSYSPPGETKVLGLFAPLYAAHSAHSWGAGSLTDWHRLTRWAAASGAQMVGTLPLLAAFLDHPVCEPSPYSPASRLFWNDFYVGIEGTPEFQSCKPAQQLFHSSSFQRLLQKVRRDEFIDYAAQSRLRRQILELMAKHFFKHDSPRRQQFARHLKARPALADYAAFRAVCDLTGKSWHNWKPRMRNGTLSPEDFDEECRQYHLYAQWLANEQLCELLKATQARGAQFYLDLPLGVHPDGYDIWRQRDCFAFPASVGAPPDSFFTKGQNWGFAPLHPRRLREHGYAYVIDYLQFQMRNTSLLRIDHVMGLHRLYWIPPGRVATDGAYVRYPAEELHAILSLESHRQECALVGENLGTVPPEVNTAMTRHGIRKIYVVQYEQSPDLSKALRTPPSKAVASINTHDMPTLAAHLNGLDIDDRVKLGLISQSESRQDRAKRKKLIAVLKTFLRRKRLLKSAQTDDASVCDALIEWLCKSDAEFVQLNLEDLWLESRPQNVPGTTRERPNWQRKMTRPLEELESSTELRDKIRHWATLRQT